MSKFIKSVKDRLNSDEEALRIFKLQREIRNKANELKKEIEEEIKKLAKDIQ